MLLTSKRVYTIVRLAIFCGVFGGARHFAAFSDRP